MLQRHLLETPISVTVPGKKESQQIGFGEYAFQMSHGYHGIVIVKIENGKICNWREYQCKSPLDWNDFQGQNRF